MSKHTKGPWAVSPARGPFGWAVESPGTEEMLASRIGEEADARLMATAPELLEALDESALVIHAAHSNRFAECPDSICRSNRAALAKARVES